MHLLILKKDHIITLYSYSMILPGQLCITMELALNDLSAHIKAKENGCLTLHSIRSIALQALSGLEYLHGKNVTHRDLKPSNILVTKWDQITDTFEIKLADFGLSSKESEPRTRCGTQGFRAPEVEYGKIGKDGKLSYAYTTAVDIWAMGKLLHNLLGDWKQLGGKGRRSQAIAPALRLITQMMDPKPDNRPTAAQCLQSHWLRQKEPVSKPLARKRKASPHDDSNHRAKGAGMGDEANRRFKW